MKVILLKDVKKIGKKYDIKEVADGFAINKLIPGKFAMPATQANLNLIESKKKEIAAEVAKTEAEVNKMLEQVKNIGITVKGKVNDKGLLFAGLHAAEIVAAVKAQTGVVLPAEQVLLDKPIKEVGDHSIKIKYGSREAVFKLTIQKE